MPRPDSLPIDWQLLERKPMWGGQATAIPVRHEDGREGVYRELKNPLSDVERKRFRRELKILSKIQHRSIVTLHDWSDEGEHPWYISELGDQFDGWWKRQKKEIATNPEELVERAVGVIRDISSALLICHENGIVHRDIKPKNLIIKRRVPDPWPILIDFGIAHDEEGNRFTASNDAVGNERFSPDIMRSRLDDVPPWLDVFDLAQLLIWMLDVKAPKNHWRRPVHWKHAIYSEEIPQELQMSIRAFTAACSTKVTSPADAAQTMRLLGELFPQQSPKPKTTTLFDEVVDELFGELFSSQLPEPSGGIGPTVITDARRRGEAKRQLTNAAIQEEIESAEPLAQSVYHQLREAILTVLDDVSNQEPSAKVLTDNSFHYQIIGATDLLSVRAGPPECGIVLRIKAKVVTRSGTPISNESNRSFWLKNMPEDAICFTFALEGGIPEAGDSRYEDGRWITILRDGTFRLHPLSGGFFGGYSDNDLGGGAEGPGKAASISDVCDFVASLFTNVMYWEFIAERRMTS